MAFYVSPGVYARERDMSDIVPSISSTIGALVGYSTKGSLDRVLITNKQQFIEEYGKPVVGDYFHYTALAFLENGTQLYCKRVVNNALHSGLSMVSIGDPAVLFPGLVTKAHYEESGMDFLFTTFAKDPGVWGNKLSVEIADIKGLINNSDEEYPLGEQYTFEIKVYLTDEYGDTAQVESFTVSRKTKIDGYGKQLYLESRINSYSKYINVQDSDIADITLPIVTSRTDLGGGTDGDAITASLIAGATGSGTGWYDFENVDDIDVRILMDGGYTSSLTSNDIVVIQTAMLTVAESRRDCIAIFTVPQIESETVTSAVNYRENVQNFNSSYCALYSGWGKVNDSWNDRIVEIPLSGHIASQMAYTDYVSDPWFAPAGTHRGILKLLGVTKVYTQGERDVLQVAGINPIQQFRGEGIAIWGQKTQKKQPSALDRVNVRRLLITIEKALSVALRTFLFEPNSELTRFRIRTLLDNYLDMLSARGAFQSNDGDKGFLVICDTQNNTPTIIDANELHVDVFVKPIKAVEYIRLQTIITTTGASFNELISKGALL